jgi:hypothetical protein
MATSAQILSNRQNSLHSTGPVTIEGRRIASQNSRKHGLCSKQIVLPGEDPAEYDALRQSLLADYAPVDNTERTLVEELAAGSWRLARARRHETAILRKLIGDAADPEAAFAELFVEKPKELERLLRYVTTIERSYYRALNKLEKLQKERRASQAKSVPPPNLLPVPSREIGFVSQKTTTAGPERLSPRKLLGAAGSRRR